MSDQQYYGPRIDAIYHSYPYSYYPGTAYSSTRTTQNRSSNLTSPYPTIHYHYNPYNYEALAYQSPIPSYTHGRVVDLPDTPRTSWPQTRNNESRNNSIHRSTPRNVEFPAGARNGNTRVEEVNENARREERSDRTWGERLRNIELSPWMQNIASIALTALLQEYSSDTEDGVEHTPRSRRR